MDDSFINHIANNLELNEQQILSNISELGHTGSASASIVFAQNYDKLKQGDLVCLAVFGGGYSSDSALIKFR